jgi:hypothetical protein
MVAKKRNMTQSTIDEFFLAPIMYCSSSLLMDFNDLKELETPKHWILFKVDYGHLVNFSQTQVHPASVFFCGKFSPHGNQRKAWLMAES